MQKEDNNNKEWYTKNEILDLYPIGITTYKKRIKKLDNPQYSSSTRLNKSILGSSNSNYKCVREIHCSALECLFGNTRVPNNGCTDKVIKWVNNHYWDWFGDIVPGKSYPVELKGKMKYFFSQLKKDTKKDSALVLFYSIEKNTDDEYFHTHFLLKVESKNINRPYLMSKLELICEENNRKEERIYIEPYDYQKYGKRGSTYNMKNLQFGYEILK
jgi:hypothetical protein